jgi:hypothetical protein
MSLNLEIIEEIVRLGAENQHIVTDPSKSCLLSEAGVAVVTAHIERLSLVGLVKDAVPIFGKDGRMWIGYAISEKGILCSKDFNLLEITISDLVEKPIDEVSKSVFNLIESCKLKTINLDYKETFIKTLEEIAICFQNDCYIATITLSGKILEICIIDLLKSHDIEVGHNQTLGSLLKKANEKIPVKYLDPTLGSIANIISKSRNTAVHYNESIPIPSRDQSIMVIYATRDVVNRYLKW